MKVKVTYVYDIHGLEYELNKSSTKSKIKPKTLYQKIRVTLVALFFIYIQNITILNIKQNNNWSYRKGEKG